VCLHRRAVHVWKDQRSGVGGTPPGRRVGSGGERTLAEVQLNASDPAVLVRLATAQVLLALYWELAPSASGSAADPPGTGDDDTAADDPSLEWVSALLCAPPGLDHDPGTGADVRRAVR
jgi:hypothetical protein